MQRLMAWLGTALKSSQPCRSASRRSEKSILRMTGVAVSCAGGASGAALPEYCVAMVVISLDAADLRGTVCGNDHDQARREDSEPPPAMSRTETEGYSDLPKLSLTLE